MAIFVGRRRISNGEIARVGGDPLWRPCGIRSSSVI
jgi:hypothetical protein